MIYVVSVLALFMIHVLYSEIRTLRHNAKVTDQALEFLGHDLSVYQDYLDGKIKR